MLGKIEGGRRRGHQRTRWLDSITDSKDTSLIKLQGQWRTGKPGMLQSIGSRIVGHDWATKQRLLKAIYSFNAISIKISMISFLCRNRKGHPKVHQESQRILNRQNHLWKDEKSHRTHTFEFQHALQRFSNQNYVIFLTSQNIFDKSRHIDRWNRIDSPEINPCINDWTIFDKSAKIIQWGKDNLFNKWHCKKWITICKIMKLDPYLIPYTKFNSKCVRDKQQHILYNTGKYSHYLIITLYTHTHTHTPWNITQP